MATQTGDNSMAASDPLFGELSRNWGWLLAIGVISLILGIVGLGMTFALTMVSVLFFGMLFIVGGIVQLVQAFKCKGWKGVVLHVLMAILYVIAGVWMVASPLAASLFLTLMIAGVLIAVGIMRIIMAVQMSKTSTWIWPLVGGIISILLGVMILSGWPVSGLWVIGLFVAVELIVNGWSYIFIAFAARSGAKTGQPVPKEAVS